MISPLNPGGTEQESEPGEYPSRPAASSPSHPTGDDDEVTGRPITAAESRRRTDHDVLLPDVPAEETDHGWGEPPDAADDDRLWRDRPPHHLP